ncbi:hypothetical protein [Burkholderia ubonensis]|nr:hypothetical protein [Burkholderia ubonensis]
MDNGQLLLACLLLAAFLMNCKRIVRWATNADAHNNPEDNKK